MGTGLRYHACTPMDYLAQHLDFRPFSLDTDLDSLVDLHRARDVLEGGWFDDDGRARLHCRTVHQAGGLPIAGIIRSTVVCYLDLFAGAAGSEGFVPTLRFHHDFLHPLLVHRALEFLRQKNRETGVKGVVVLVDDPALLRVLEQAGAPPERRYHRIALAGELSAPPQVQPTVGDAAGGDLRLAADGWEPFLGRPVPPAFAARRAFAAHGHAVPGYRRAICKELRHPDGPTYLGLFDGREWLVFRRERHARDPELIRATLTALVAGEDGPAPLLASTRVLETLAIDPQEPASAWDFFVA